jgi:hypothetical protein
MASVVISKIKVRRGTNAQRQNIVLDQGELGYTIDTNRLYVGNGTSSGGLVVGSKIHPPIFTIGELTSVIAEIGDIVWANGIFYQLIYSDYTDLASWKDVGALLNSSYFEYNGNNEITLKNNVIKLQNLNTEVSEQFQVQVDNSSIEYVGGNTLQLKDLGIGSEKLQSYSVTNDKLAPNVVGSGLIGGQGAPITLNFDETYFYITSGGKLAIIPDTILTFGDNITTVKNLTGGISIKTNSIDQLYIKSSSFGGGLSGGSGNFISINADTTTFGFNSASQLKINTNSIDETLIKTSMFGNGLQGGNGTKATLKINPNLFTYNAISALTLLSASIDKDYINFGAFGNGLKGGSGQVIELKVKENLFNFEVGKLTLSANSVTEQYISSDAFQYGIQGGNNQKISINATTNFTFTTANKLDLSQITNGSINGKIKSSILSGETISLSSGVSFPRISWDDFGRITNIKTSIVEVLTGRGAVTGTIAASNSLSSIFNGFITEGPQMGNIATFAATDHNNNTYTLSSAGFLAFDSENTSLSGQRLKRFAIPIFAY